MKYNVLDKSKTARSKLLNTVSGIAGLIEIEISEQLKFEEATGVNLNKRKEKFDSFMSTILKRAEELSKRQNDNK